MLTEDRRVKSPRWCKNCGRLDIRSHNRCSACAQYYQTHGRERPRHLFEDRGQCKNCKIPLVTLGKMPCGKNRYKRGLCNPCYNYKYVMGVPRPRHLWGIGEYGWCACGYPANYQKDGFNLCSRCAEV